ncbi:MAG: hypothetical protein AB7O98_12870 [Hyphomonadaceae bacterium]
MSDTLAFSLSAEAEALIAAADLSAAMSGRTFRYYDPFHGAQFEYYAPDGTAYLWYPGNKISVASAWHVEGERTAHEDTRKLCFVYGPRIYNPVTQEWGGRPECEPVRKAMLFVQESAAGDVFKLERGTVPWVLIGQSQHTITQVLSLYRSPIRWGRRL